MMDQARHPTHAAQPTRESRAGLALVCGIASLVLIWPFGIILGPLALWLGIWSLRRINRAQGLLTGKQIAIAGVAAGGVTCGFYALALCAEVAAVILFGQLIPAAN